MKTTFELERKISGKDKKSIFENLNMQETIRNVVVDDELARVSFDYMTWADLQIARRELHELGYQLINDTHRFDAENLL
jgi:hypothetical protein